jgi:Transposase DDE domain
MNTAMILWNQWSQQVKALFPMLHGHQQKTLALVVQGIVMSGSTVLPRIAETLGSEEVSLATMPSIERRLARFVANPRIDVETVWEAFLQSVLAFWKGKALAFVLDCTPYRADATIVYLGLLVHSRVLPVAWAVMPGQEKWEEGQWSIVGRLLDLVQRCVGETTECTLVADRGLAGMALVKLCQDRGWHYLFRISGEHTFRTATREGWSDWKPVSSLVKQPGDHWYGSATVWQEERLATQISARWTEGHEEGWVVISDRPAGKTRLNEYARRMRVEATFQDTKSRGWDLEASAIENKERLHRLLLGLFIAIWWVSHLAASCIHHGQRSRFDRADRRDKSIFRLGRLWLSFILKHAGDSSWGIANLTHSLPFRKRSGRWHIPLRF